MPRDDRFVALATRIRLGMLRIMLRLAVGLVLVGTLTVAEVMAQQPRRIYRIGVVNDAWAVNHPTVEGLKAGLWSLGLLEGRDVNFDIRFTEGKPMALPVAIGLLVEAKVDLLFTSNEAATRAAQAATRKIPIVFTLVGDPVTAGIVKELAHPGGNLTGVSSRSTQLVGKRLQILKTLVPVVRRIRAIYYAGDLSSRAAVAAAEAVAPQLGLTLVARPIKSPGELEVALREIERGDGLLSPDVAALDIPAAILETALTQRVPAVFPSSLWVKHGGLVSYGPDYRAQGAQAARLVAKILQGTHPANLPVEGADKIDLAINVKTTASLGVIVPRKLRLRADLLHQ